jgi:hypothetical protein
MPAEYYIILRDPSGNKVAEIDDFWDLTYSKRRWEPGLAQFSMDGNSSKIPLFVSNAQIEVWRRNPQQGIDWYCDFYGLFRKQVRETPNQIDYFRVFAPGQMTMLGWACVMWPDKTTGRSVFTGLPAESIMKKLVNWNVTTNATTANGRLVSWPFSTISVQTDGGRGNTIDWKCALKNLLTELQSIAAVAGGDFDLVKTGPAAWEFRFYPGQMGTDRTATVQFALNLGNMAEPKYTRDQTNEATIAVVGGKGDARDRTFVTVTGATYNIATNYIETFVTATDQDSNAYLTAKGKEALYKAQARNQFGFTVLQTPSTQYGRDYFMGDLVRANYKGFIFNQVIHGVTVNYPKEGKETIRVETRDL